MTGIKDRMAGIFMIKNCALGRAFIGCSLKVRDAKNYYFSQLRRGEAKNQALQKDFETFGEQEFEFSIVEFCSGEELRDKKEFYISFYKTYDCISGYNVIRRRRAMASRRSLKQKNLPGKRIRRNILHMHKI